MRYCTECVIPSTRPNISLDERGVCNACRAHKSKTSIDWPARENLFTEVAANARERSESYDCLVPVSGGKDSTWQVLKVLEHGLTPLCVTWKSPARTAIGARNLANLIDLGVDHIDFQISPRTERAFMLAALERFGATAVPMHMALFNIPLSIAVRRRIPLVVWGENSAFEYGGDDDAREGFKLDRAWLRTHGVTHGTTAEDWISDRLPSKAMNAYHGPSDEELVRAGVVAVFLGYYYEWDPQMTAAVAKAHGFEAGSRPRTGFYEFADIDDDFISIHHWLKWYKFGLTRLFDNLSIEIRNGRISRDRAVEIIAETGDQTPHDDIEKLCKYLDISTQRFFEIAETFRDPKVWTRRGDTHIIEGFLIKDWDWSNSR